jgi:hypothetical protein
MIMVKTPTPFPLPESPAMGRIGTGVGVTGWISMSAMMCDMVLGSSTASKRARISSPVSWRHTQRPEPARGQAPPPPARPAKAR